MKDRLQSLQSVTVLIAAYNAAGFLRRAVKSALAQSLPILEVLIVDDASTDNTVSVAEELALQDRRVRVITMERNGGPSAARNAGLDAAKGDWVAILDADDAYLPERLELMLRAAVDCSADIVADGFRFFDAATGAVVRSTLEADDRVETITLHRFLSNAKPFGNEPDWGLLKPIFRKAFLEQNGLRYPHHSRHGEDFLLIVEALLKGAHYVLVRHGGYLYTTRSSGLSRTTVNYPQMCQHSKSLMTDPRIASEPALVKALKLRISALVKLSAEYDLAIYRRDRNYESIIRRVLLDGPFRATVTEKVFRKLRNALQIQ